MLREAGVVGDQPGAGQQLADVGAGRALGGRGSDRQLERLAAGCGEDGVVWHRWGSPLAAVARPYLGPAVPSLLARRPGPSPLQWQGVGMLGLPDAITVCLFDLDGVLTDTASVHRRAWKQTFDPLLRARGEPPFTEADYNKYVDGKPRADGVRDFLASRGIDLPDGNANDATGGADRAWPRQPQERAAAARTSTRTACRSTRVLGGTCGPPVPPGCDARSCPRAPTRARSCRSPGWIGSSRNGSTASR